MKLYWIIPLLALVSACNFTPQDKVVPEWEMEILGPLVKGDLTINNISELDDIHASQAFSLSDFGVINPGIPITIPAFGPMNLGPYALDLTDSYGQAEFERGDLYFVINNGLEINVNSGTTIILKDGATTLLSNTIATDISALGGTYTSPVSNLANKTVSDQLSLEIQAFSTDGSGTPVTINPSRRLVIDVYIKNVKVKSISITAAENFSITDTSDFSISGTNIGSQSVSGILNTYITNQFPLDFTFQMYFMDETKTVKLDSLFDIAPVVTGSGGTPVETKFVTNLNQTKINNLNNSSYARTVLKLQTNSTINLENTLQLKMQMVGDLKLQLNP